MAATNQSLGPIAIGDLTLEAINEALRQLVERIDYLQGLRGDLNVYSGVALKDPLRVRDENDTLVHAMGTPA